MTPKRLSPTASAGLLALLLAASGQAPGNAPVAVQQSRAEQTPAQSTTTKTPAAPTTQAQRPLRVFRGGGRDPRQAYNPIRRARRRLEALGIITSGRQWRNFRKYARHNPIVADFWLRTLRGEV